MNKILLLGIIFLLISSCSLKDRVIFKDSINQENNNEVQINKDGKIVLTSPYYKDEDNVYRKCTECEEYNIIEGADPKTITLLDEGYLKDKNNVFYINTKIIGADPKTFEILSDYFAKDNNNVYRPTGAIFNGVDAKTVEVIGGSYIKDKNGVYYGDYYYGEPIIGADRDTFELINDYIIAKDKNNVYDMYFIYEGGDPETFQELSNGYSKDKNNVYYLGGILKGADTNTFKFKIGKFKSTGKVYDGEDKNNKYYSGKKTEE